MRDGRIQVGRSCLPDGGGEVRDTADTRGGGGDRPGRVTGRRIEAGSTMAGEDSVDRDVAVGSILDRQWGRARGRGVEGLPLLALWH